ncbi:alpha/beta hydrolase [Glutamicibacter sp. JL.03c]|uniref:alpha/beta hydrolase n=1 Tax=Glutamicibacter sp. JL.03c TaxID=2984842 RepID=UPI0021F79553|nr:alpha/beta hydrolase [Glutamicibacter sp. JL.03c]UYQ78087.1 alpha/beta hydrolase [Glutamicibacter sp. JL.03c]
MPVRLSKLRLLAVGTLLALTGLTSCSAGSPLPDAEGTDASPSTSAPDAPRGLESYYAQQIDWGNCGDALECATIKVPLDYGDPTGESIELSLNRRTAESASRNLLVNPGGPGGSGLDMVESSVQTMFSDQLQQSYNIIGFDPRGVGESSPVTCQSDAETDEGRQENLRAWLPEDQEQIIEETEDYAADCAANTGDLLGHVDTVSAAKDMDVIRAVLGDKQLDYLGFSYGTFLGATYADLFPQKVGRFVLDGAMDPKSQAADLTKAQAVGFEHEIEAWLAQCIGSEGCPFSGTVESAKVQLQQFFAQVENEPMVSSDGRTVPIIDFVNGFILPLYDNTNWPYLTQAMASAVNDGDVDTILGFADLAADRQSDGTYASNSSDAFTAINCLDRPMNAGEEEMGQEATELMRVAPTLGKYLSYGEIVCDVWDHKPTGKAGALDAKESNEILVVGTTSDPATPYQWSQSLAEQLDNATLLTYQGHGHTAYGRSNDCITNAVDGYLIDGKAPASGTRC